ncbi:SocA family protein [Lichenihabitans sp. PAMC28606]|uniref:SocA family protein n=1 Tax=Lichenihabitans sp. PAMC28606 TaxID=2880932 RepID=UPI001D0B979D|nr:SocA family protein [Lichenihabitans sp. PAMC28606]UDL96150.1 SocA family protein [Lichenihabitans sp. PAMC28606]
MNKYVRPVLRANYRKTVEVILFLIEEAERKGVYVTTYDILKTIFVADVSHINNYGRPVSFDNYYAMKDGPVPSAAYELLGDERPEKYGHVHGEWPLWQKEASPSDGNGVVKFVRPKRSANTRLLSETDISALREAMSLIKAQSFTETRDMTHEYPAYIEAWQEKGDKKSYLMDFSLLVEEKDDDFVSDVVHASHYS